MEPGTTSRLTMAPSTRSLLVRGAAPRKASGNLVIAEMLRVARQAIFISDNNTFGQGGVSNAWPNT